jgi:hypothetical protein
LVEHVLDSIIEWICVKMDTHYESFRVIKIFPRRYHGFKLDTVNYMFRCCAVNFRVVLGVSHRL